MKKTLMINLGGIVFHIDEDAYQLLYQYLESLRRHFSSREGAQEILVDIESRMAEIFGEKRTGSSQVITMEEVSEVISVMGKPDEIGPGEEEGGGTGASENKGVRRLFRDPDNRILAGVCSGFAGYFGVDPVWMRLIFILVTLAFGSGILLYLVMWILIPEAKSTSEKLEMKGRKIDIRSIEHSIREEVSGIGGRLGTMAGESARTIRQAGSGLAPAVRAVGRGLTEVLRVLMRIVIVGAGLVLSLLSLGTLILVTAYLLGWTGGIYADNDFTVLDFPALARITVGCDMPVYYLQLILLMVIGIPLFMLLYNGVRMVLRFKRVRYLGLTMLNIWIVGAFLFAWSGMRVYSLYKYDEKKQMEIPLQNPSTDTLNVILNGDDPGMKYLHNEQFVLAGDLRAVANENHELYMVPKLRVEESPDSLFSITQISMARGKSRSEAYQHLAGMQFRTATSGDTLRMSPFVRLPMEGCWRGQVLDLVIRVPRGKCIRFDKNIRELKPYWNYLLEDDREEVFMMTEYGLANSVAGDEGKPVGDTTATKTIRP